MFFSSPGSMEPRRGAFAAQGLREHHGHVFRDAASRIANRDVVQGRLPELHLVRAGNRHLQERFGDLHLHGRRHGGQGPFHVQVKHLSLPRNHVERHSLRASRLQPLDLPHHPRRRLFAKQFLRPARQSRAHDLDPLRRREADRQRLGWARAAVDDRNFVRRLLADGDRLRPHRAHLDRRAGSTDHRQPILRRMTGRNGGRRRSPVVLHAGRRSDQSARAAHRSPLGRRDRVPAARSRGRASLPVRSRLPRSGRRTLRKRSGHRQILWQRTRGCTRRWTRSGRAARQDGGNLRLVRRFVIDQRQPLGGGGRFAHRRGALATRSAQSNATDRLLSTAYHWLARRAVDPWGRQEAVQLLLRRTMRRLSQGERRFILRAPAQRGRDFDRDRRVRRCLLPHDRGTDRDPRNET